jgi:nucleoside-diphosphate-sugar epimerase
VGEALAELLVTRGDQVSALVRSPLKAERLRARGIALVAGDLADETALDALVAGCDVVFHVAGKVAARSPGEFLRVNRDGTGRLAQAAARAGVARFVLVSSLAVTGPSRPGQALGEDAPERPLTRYGRSKQAGEQAAREAGVPLTIVRPSAVYGPGDRSFLTLFRAAARGIVPLLGDGSQPLTLLHVRDLALALVAAAESPATLGRTYHAGHETPVTQRALAHAVGRAVGRDVRAVPIPAAVVGPALAVAGGLARALGRAPLLDGDKARELLASGWVASSAALRRDAGWLAQIPLAAGLAETVLHYREAGWL